MFSERIRVDIEQRLVWIFSEMWLTGNRQTRALFAGQKNQNFRSHFCVDGAQNLSGNIQTIYSE